MFNSHTIENYNNPLAGGFTGSDFLLDPYTYQYFNASLSRNGGKPVSYSGQYSPDVIAEKAFGFLEEAISDEKPFFLAIAPIAPHSAVQMGGEPQFSEPKYAPRHANLFKDYQIPRTKNFNPDKVRIIFYISSMLPELTRFKSQVEQTGLHSSHNSTTQWLNTTTNLGVRVSAPSNP